MLMTLQVCTSLLQDFNFIFLLYLFYFISRVLAVLQWKQDERRWKAVMAECQHRILSSSTTNH